LQIICVAAVAADALGTKRRGFMTQKLLLMAAGGTGGHMFPAQALAEEMLRKGWRVKLSTDARGARYTGGFPHTVEITEVSSATFARGGLLAKALVGPKIAGGIASRCQRIDHAHIKAGNGSEYRVVNTETVRAYADEHCNE